MEGGDEGREGEGTRGKGGRGGEGREGRLCRGGEGMGGHGREGGGVMTVIHMPKTTIFK